MRTPVLDPALVSALKKLKLGYIAETLPERLVLANKQDLFALRAVELAPTCVQARELLVRFFETMSMRLNAKRERAVLNRLTTSR